jgi:uncharacterized repeat protein (TIGR03803 family)
MSRNSAFFAACQLALLVLGLAFSATAWAARETVLYTFPEDGSTGNYPESALVADKAGNLYGTTLFGGVNPVNCSNGFGCGTVFELSPPSQPGGAWTETVLYEFQGGGDGEGPQCTLVIDDSGNLYGTSSYGYPSISFGLVVWELSPPSQPGGAWTETTLYNFPGLYLGYYGNQGSLLMDRIGNLYGTTYLGGTTGGNCGIYGCGTVFETSPPLQFGGAWTGAILYSFQGGSDSETAGGSLMSDSRGALYGMTLGSGECPPECGTVFQLQPPSEPGGSWTETVLYAFNGGDGDEPSAGLIFDRKGNLYGTTGYGGPLSCDYGRQGCGNVFELSPPAQPGEAWTETVLYNFMVPKTGDGQYPDSSLIMDGRGNLYGTTSSGGYRGAGTVFELVPPGSPGGAWTELRLSLGSDPNGDAYYPAAGLIFGPGEAVSGTGTGEFDGGGVFSITP